MGLAELSRNRLALAGVLVLAAIAVLALIAPVIMTDPTAQNIEDSMSPPSPQHWFGTDSFGRDVASRVIHGARISLTASLVPVVASLLIGVPIGLLAGTRGGAVDAIAMRIVDAFLSFPAILLAVAIMGVLGPSIQNVMLALALVYIPFLARLARASTLSVSADDYVLAARAVGASEPRIAFRHILPNIIAPLTVQTTANFSSAIIAESTLSFLGLGNQPPTPSWGLILNEGRRYLSQAPWIALAAGTAITLCVLAVNFVGDGLRDALDPQYRQD